MDTIPRPLQVVDGTCPKRLVVDAALNQRRYIDVTSSSFRNLVRQFVDRVAGAGEVRCQ